MKGNSVFRQGDSSTRTYLSVRCMVFFLLFGPLSTCATENRPSYTAIPIESLVDTFKGEQGEIIRQYGLPDRALQGPLNTTRWIYCSGLKRPIIIEFDVQGQILLKYNTNDTSACPASILKQRTSIRRLE